MSILEGHFTSPFEQHLPDLLPESCKRAHFQMVLPIVWPKDNYRPVCIHLAGTGDHVGGMGGMRRDTVVLLHCTRQVISLSIYRV